MEKSINDIFKDLFIVVDGKPVPINAIGLMTMDNREFIVLTDMEGLVDSDEYIIVEMIREENGFSIVGIENETLYDEICEAWEEYAIEKEDAAIDS